MAEAIAVRNLFVRFGMPAGQGGKPLAFLACFGKRFTGCQSSHAPAQPVEKCIEEFSGNRASIDL